MVCEIMNLFYTIGALIAWKTSQDHQNEIISTLCGRQRDGLSCWSREGEIRSLRTHGGGLGEGGRPKEQKAGYGEDRSPNPTDVNCAGLLGANGRLGKIGHDEA